MEARRLRLQADVKVGVSLGGGLESSTVAGMVSQLHQGGEKVGHDVMTGCFGVAFDESGNLLKFTFPNKEADG